MIDRQRGFTLISLMVGTVISMIGILALLLLYKGLVGTSVTALSNAKQDGQIASAQLTVQKELLTAGFGVVGSSPTTITLLKNAKLNGSTLSGDTMPLPPLPLSTLTGDKEGNAIVWPYYETLGGTLKCAGLLVQEDTSAPGSPTRLYRLQGTTNCAVPLNYASPTWSKTILIAEGQKLPAANEAKPWPFAGRVTPCWPFVKRSDSSTIEYPQITFKTQTSSIDGSGVPLVTSTTLCLPNLPAP